MSKKVLVGITVGVVIVVAVILLSGKNEGPADRTPVSSFTHAHGLATDATGSPKLYIATHNGLFVLENERDLYRLGNTKDDYMGFSAHPSNAQVFFTSGHPTTGGNLGFQKSEDGGNSWRKVSNGANGPVDFHAMAVGQVTPNVIYGWYGGSLQRSNDEGATWQAVRANIGNVISLVTDSKAANTVYAATASGLFISQDQGQTWNAFAPNLGGAAVAALAVNPGNNQELVAYSEKTGLAKSADGGQNWTRLTGLPQETVLYLAYTKPNPNTLYALTESNSIYRSSDSGATWNKLR